MQRCEWIHISCPKDKAWIRSIIRVKWRGGGVGSKWGYSSSFISWLHAARGSRVGAGRGSACNRGLVFVFAVRVFGMGVGVHVDRWSVILQFNSLFTCFY